MRRSFSRLSNKGDRAGCRNAAGARTLVTGAFRPSRYVAAALDHEGGLQEAP